MFVKCHELMQIQMFISCCIVGWACLPKKKKKGYKIWVEW